MPKRLVATDEAKLEASRIIMQRWQDANWPSVREFCRETGIALQPYTVGRLVVHGDALSLESVLHLCYFLCDRSETVELLKMLGDKIIHKYIVPDEMSADDNKMISMFRRLPIEHKATILTIIERMV